MYTVYCELHANKKCNCTLHVYMKINKSNLGFDIGYTKLENFTHRLYVGDKLLCVTHKKSPSEGALTMLLSH